MRGKGERVIRDDDVITACSAVAGVSARFEYGVNALSITIRFSFNVAE